MTTTLFIISSIRSVSTDYIQDMKHLSLTVKSVLWQQYDFLLASRPYDWYAIVDHADYMESADFEGIESLTIDSPGNLNSELELVNIYSQDKVGLKKFDKLREEQSALAIAGKSRALNGPVKIVWYNQLNVLRVFTTIDNELLIKNIPQYSKRTYNKVSNDSPKVYHHYGRCFPSRNASTYRGLRIVYKYDDGFHEDFNVSEQLQIEYYD